MTGDNSNSRIARGKNILFLLLVVSAAIAATAWLYVPAESESGSHIPTELPQIELPRGITPVKDQGSSATCWAYAMLATIETNHIRQGDSVHLSVGYAVRHLIEDNYHRFVQSKGKSKFTTRATAQTLLNIINRHGIVPHSAYRKYEKANATVICNKARRLAETCINTTGASQRHLNTLNSILNESLGAKPLQVMMLGAEYTPQEFARSVCAPGEYAALTSFSHHPFYSSFSLEVPDNWENNTFYNLPVDSLMARISDAVNRNEAVCWEGDISEPGFSFKQGMADLTATQRSDLSQNARQGMFESHQTTDDHSMAIVGAVDDKQGRRFYIMKNSWGTDNPLDGLMLMSEDYLRMKTIAVWVRHRD